jgi:hypothetical protein
LFGKPDKPLIMQGDDQAQQGKTEADQADSEQAADTSRSDANAEPPDPPTAPAQRQIGYPTVCPGWPDPGTGAAPPADSALHALWLGRLASPQQPGIDRAAIFAHHQAINGRLRGGYSRIEISSGGDFYIVETIGGSHVLIRLRSGAGPSGDSDTDDCAKPASVNVAYVELSPGLVGAWLAAAANNALRPGPDPQHPDQVIFTGQDGRELGRASCVRCQLTVGGQRVSAPVATFVTPAQILAALGETPDAE